MVAMGKQAKPTAMAWQIRSASSSGAGSRAAMRQCGDAAMRWCPARMPPTISRRMPKIRTRMPKHTAQSLAELLSLAVRKTTG